MNSLRPVASWLQLTMSTPMKITLTAAVVLKHGLFSQPVLCVLSRVSWKVAELAIHALQ